MKTNLLKSLIISGLTLSSLNALAQDVNSTEIEHAISSIPYVPMQIQTERYSATREALDAKLLELAQAQDKPQFDSLLQQSRQLAQQAKAYTQDLYVDWGDATDNRRVEEDIFYKQYKLNNIIKSLDQAEQMSQTDFASAQQLAKHIS